MQQNKIIQLLNNAFNLVLTMRDAQIAGPTNGSPCMAYSMVVPIANYSPWVNDQAFQSVYQQVIANTLVDQYRLYELWHLCDQLKHLPGDVLEVGVWKGGSAVLLAQRFKMLGVDLAIYAADTFKGVVKVTAADPSYQGGEHHETSVETVQNLAQQVAGKPLTILQGIFPDDTGHTVADKTFRLVHIDVDIYESAKDVFAWAWPRLSRGGIVVFDDYGFPTCQGVTKLVNELRADSDKLMLHNLNGHAVFIKI